jgi:hypothetical protein
MSTPNDAADDQVEMFKVKKLIKSLQAARGYAIVKCGATILLLSNCLFGSLTVATARA